MTNLSLFQLAGNFRSQSMKLYSQSLNEETSVRHFHIIKFSKDCNLFKTITSFFKNRSIKIPVSMKGELPVPPVPPVLILLLTKI
jgi:hypothetical protein